jgi:hypothetical protein
MISYEGKGLAQLGLAKVSVQHSEVFEAFTARSGAVYGKNNFALGQLAKVMSSLIRDDELAAALIDIALHGNATQLVENDILRSRGKGLLKATG